MSELLHEPDAWYDPPPLWEVRIADAYIGRVRRLVRALCPYQAMMAVARLEMDAGSGRGVKAQARMAFGRRRGRRFVGFVYWSPAPLRARGKAGVVQSQCGPSLGVARM